MDVMVFPFLWYRILPESLADASRGSKTHIALGHPSELGQSLMKWCGSLSLFVVLVGRENE